MLLVPHAKVRMPPIPAGLVERTELHAELDAGDVGGVSLVCAPPGYGKSWLLADWANRPSPVRTAWLTIDGDDNDPRRLWASVLAALAPHIPLTASEVDPVLVRVVPRRAHQPRGRAGGQPGRPAEPDQADPRRRRRARSSRAAAGTADFGANPPAPAASGALEPVRTAARAEPATAVRAAPRAPGGPPALHPGRVGDPADQERTEIDGLAGGESASTNGRVGGGHAPGRARHRRRSRSRQVRRGVLRRRALRRRLPHRQRS